MVQRLLGTLIASYFAGKEVRFFVADEHDAIQHAHFLGQFYEYEELNIISHFFEAGDVFVDIGANVGNHCLYVAKFLRPADVIVIEPNPQAIDILKANLWLNGLTEVVDTSLLGFGLANKSGRADVTVPASIGANNLGAARLTLGAPGGSVEVLTGDDLLAGRKVDFIKIDVEGMELPVLDGLQATISRDRPLIFIEVDNGNFPGFQQWVERSHYVIAAAFKRYAANHNFMLLPEEREFSFIDPNRPSELDWTGSDGLSLHLCHYPVVRSRSHHDGPELATAAATAFRLSLEKLPFDLRPAPIDLAPGKHARFLLDRLLRELSHNASSEAKFGPPNIIVIHVAHGATKIFRADQAPSDSVALSAADASETSDNFENAGARVVVVLSEASNRHDLAELCEIRPKLPKEFILLAAHWNRSNVRNEVLDFLWCMNFDFDFSAEVRTGLANIVPPLLGERSNWDDGYFIATLRQGASEGATAKFALLRVPASIDLSVEQKQVSCVVRGMAPPAFGGAWTIAPCASLCFKVEQVRDLVLTVELLPFLVADKLAEQLVEVSVNYRHVADWRLTDPGWQRRSLALSRAELAKSKNVKIEFYLPNATSLVALGTGEDTRQLGVMLRRIEFAEVSVE